MTPTSTRVFALFAFAMVSSLASPAYGDGISASASTAAAPQFKSSYTGASVTGGYTQGTFGQAIVTDLGAETSGLRTLKNPALVLKWDAALLARGAYTGSADPGRIAVGAKGVAGAELGVRVMPQSKWSPYVSSGLRLEGTTVHLVSLPPEGLARVNHPSNFLGETGSATGRLSAGVSYLSGDHSVLLTGFAQESLRLPATAGVVPAYTEAGIEAQYDWAHQIRVALRASYGVTPQTGESTFGSTSQGTWIEAGASVRKTLGPRFWVGLDAKISRQSTKTNFADAAPTAPSQYETANPAVPSLTVNAGVALP